MSYRLRYQQHNLELSLGQFVIGRSTECQLSLDDPLVSRKHAKLTISPEGVFVEDLGSRNGVLVEGEKIEGRRKLTGGEKITVGGQEMFLVETQRDRAATMVNVAPAAMVTFVGGELSPNPAIPVPKPSDATPPDDQSKKADAFKLLGGVADKALAMGRAEEAERLLQSLLQQIQDAQKARRNPAPEVLEQAGRFGARLAAATSKGQWVDYVVGLYTRDARVMPGAVVDELYTAVRKVSGFDLVALREYIELMHDQTGNFGPNERFVLQRLEGLERLASLKLPPPPTAAARGGVPPHPPHAGQKREGHRSRTRVAFSLGAGPSSLTRRSGTGPVSVGDQKSPWPWPAWPPPPEDFSSLGRSATRHSVVSMRPATEAAFWRAVRTTLAGSMTPCSRRSPYSPVAAL
jgi:hypothetical protein